MLRITPEASDHLRRIRKDKGLDDKVRPRLFRNEGRLGLSFVETPAQHDALIEDAEMPILVAPDVVQAFGAGTIDVRSRDGHNELVLRRPPAPGEPAEPQVH